MNSMKYVRIIDKGECMSTLHLVPTFPWPEPFLKEIANKEEWAKYKFYPSNGLVAQVPYFVKFKQMFIGTVVDVYILKITDNIYVPMTANGIEFISEETYLAECPNNKLRNMDVKQENLNDRLDSFLDMLNNRPAEYIGGRFPFGIEKEADIYCNSVKSSFATYNPDEHNDIIEHYSQYFRSHDMVEWSKEYFISELIRWTKSEVRDNGWEDDDEDGVAYCMGLFIKGWCRAKDEPTLFDEIFKKAFIRYFS